MSDIPMAYLVTSGSYSDYRVSAVFDTEEGAAAYIAGQADGPTGYDIEVFRLNTATPPTRAPFDVYVLLRTGREVVEKVSEEKGGWDGDVGLSGVNVRPGHWQVSGVVLAEDEAHARKTAKEFTMRYMAQQRGMT